MELKGICILMFREIFSGMQSHLMKYELVELKLNDVFQILNNYIEGISINYFFKRKWFLLGLKQLEIRNCELAMLSCISISI